MGWLVGKAARRQFPVVVSLEAGQERPLLLFGEGSPVVDRSSWFCRRCGFLNGGDLGVCWHCEEVRSGGQGSFSKEQCQVLGGMCGSELL